MPIALITSNNNTANNSSAGVTAQSEERMEKIGTSKIWSYFDDQPSVRAASNHAIRAGTGHRVKTYFELAKKIAELQFLNRDHVLLFRGQHSDYRSIKGNSMLKASLFRLNGRMIPRPKTLEDRFSILKRAESALLESYVRTGFQGSDRLKRHRNPEVGDIAAL